MVSGWRSQRGDNFILRRIPSARRELADGEVCQASNIHDFGTTFKAYRREVIQNIPLYGEMHRFIPALASWYGASICEIPDLATRSASSARATTASRAPSASSSTC